MRLSEERRIRLEKARRRSARRAREARAREAAGPAPDPDLFPDLGDALYGRYKAALEDAHVDGEAWVPLDHSEGGRHMTQATVARRPLIRDGRTPSGRAAFEHVAADTHWCALPDTVPANSPFTAWGFLKRKSPDPPVVGAGTGLWALSAAAQGHWPWTDGKIYESAGSPARLDLGNPATPLDDWVRYAVRVAPDGVGGSVMTAWLNGSIFAGPTVMAGLPAPRAIAMGQSLGGAYHFDGEWAELVLCTVALTDAQVEDDLDAYAAAEYL